MKNIVLILSAVLNGIFIWAACQNGGSSSTGAAADSLSAAAYKPIPDSVKVPYKEAKHMVANYGPHAGTVKHGKDSMPDTRAIWFDLERLQTLIHQIRLEGGDGLRFYLATYDDSYPPMAQGPHVPQRAYWGYNTLLMVSTKDSTANGEVFHRDYYPETHNKGLIVAAPIENKGEICPPPGDCEAEGALLLGIE